MGEALTRQLLKQAQISFGCQTEPILRENQEINCPYSVVRRIKMDCDGISRVVYLKRVKTEGISTDVARNRALVEYQILTQLYEHFQAHRTWGVARPIAVFPEQLVIVTEEVPGRQLMEMIGKSAKRYMFEHSQDILQRYCTLAGTWLREFQSFTNQGAGAFNIQGLLQYCDARLDTLITDGRSGIDEKFKAKFRSFLKSKHEEMKQGANVIVGRHNDFSPHNIIVDKGRVSVIDFGFFDHDSHLYDVCRFWFQLECMKLSPFFNASTIDQLQRSFFEGYGGSIDHCDPAFEMVASRYFVTRLATMTKEGMRGGLRGWIDRRSYKWCLGWLTQHCVKA